MVWYGMVWYDIVWYGMEYSMQSYVIATHMTQDHAMPHDTRHRRVLCHVAFYCMRLSDRVGRVLHYMGISVLHGAVLRNDI